MVDAGIVTATFKLVSKNMTQGIKEIQESLNGLDSRVKKVGDSTSKTNKHLTDSEKIVKQLTKSTTLNVNALKKQLDATKLTNTQKMKLVDTIGRLEKGVRAGNISVTDYHKSLRILSKQYGLTYKDGTIFEKQIKKTSNLMKELTQNQITTEKKMLGSNKGMNAFSADIAKANQELRKGIMTYKEYDRYRRALAKKTGVKVLNDGFIATPEYIAKAKSKVNDYVKTYDAMLLQQKRGLIVSQEHRDAIEKAGISEKKLQTWLRQNVITQSDYNRVTERMNGSLENRIKTVNSLTKSYGSLSNATNMLSRSQRIQNYAMQIAAMRYNAVGLAVGAFTGMIFGDLIQGFMMGRTQAIKLDDQMRQMFKTMKLGKGAFQSFNAELDKYVAKFPKISKFTVGSTIAQVGKLNNLTLDQMKQMIPLTADMINIMQLNGRTAEDAMLAINDAFDGQFKRLQELGVQGKEQLEQYGYKAGDAGSLITALMAIDKQKGWSDLTADVSTASDAFMILGNAIDRVLVPTIGLLTPGIVAISVAIGDLMGWLNRLPPGLQAVSAIALVVGASFAVMKTQMLWAKTIGSEMMAEFTGVNSEMQKLNATMMSSRNVAQLTAEEFDQIASNMAELEYRTKSQKQKWDELGYAQKSNLITAKKAEMQYSGLTRVQKAQVRTLQQTQNVTKAEAMVQLFGADAINTRTISTNIATDADNMSIFAKMRSAFVTGTLTKAEASNTVATSGNTIAKKMNVLITNALTTASYSAGVATAFLTSTMGILLITVVALAGAIYILTGKQRAAIKTMKEYNKLIESGEDDVTKLKDASKKYDDQAKELEKTRDKLKAQGKDTTAVEKEIAEAHAKSAQMAQLAKEAQEGLNEARTVKTRIEGENTLNQNAYTEKSLDLLRQKGIITKKDAEEQKNYQKIVNEGGTQMVRALERANLMRAKGLEETKKLTEGQTEYDKQYRKNKKALLERQQAYSDLAQAKYDAETADDWGGALSGWFNQGAARLRIWWLDTSVMFETWKVDIQKFFGGIWEGITKPIGDFIGVFSGIGPQIYDSIIKGLPNISDISSKIMEFIFGWDSEGSIREKLMSWITSIDWGQLITDAVNFIGTIIVHYNPITLLVSLIFGNEAGYAFQDQIMGFFTWLTATFITGLTDIMGIVNSIGQQIYLVFNGIWSEILLVTQRTWSLLVTYITTPLTDAYNYVMLRLNLIWAIISGAWNKIVATTISTWNTIKSKIWEVIQKIWDKVSPIISGITDAWNGMKDDLISAANTIKDKVWKHVGWLWDKLNGFIEFIKNPFGSGKPKSGSPSGHAGSPGSAGFSGGYAGSTYTNNGIKSSPRNNIFSGLGNAIISTTNDLVNSTSIPEDPRFNFAGIPNAGSRAIIDPYECERKYGKNCYAGVDFSKFWIDSIKNRINNWKVNIKGITAPLADLTSNNIKMKLFEALATKLISNTSYEFYYNGRYSNAEALSRGRFNCWDGAEILIDLARGLGLKASMGKGTWGRYGHVWAIVNGKNFDTTAFQHGYGWTSPKVRGYAGFRDRIQDQSNINIKIDMRGSQINGIEDLENMMHKIADKHIVSAINENMANGI